MSLFGDFKSEKIAQLKGETDHLYHHQPVFLLQLDQADVEQTMAQ